MVVKTIKPILIMESYFAKQRLNEGCKIRHKSFLTDEYIVRSVENGQLLDETGIALNELDFWEFRDGEYWNDGWEVLDN